MDIAEIYAVKRLKNWEEGLDVAKEIVQVDPKNCQAHNEASAFHYHLGDYQQAINQANQALAVADEKWLGTIPYRLLAISYAQLGDLPKALSYADQAHAIEPSPFIPYGPLPYGTLPQFKDYLTRIASK